MRGALIIAVVFSSTAVAVGVSQYAFGLFIVPIEETFGWTRTQISASLSFAAVGGLTAPFLGRAMTASAHDRSSWPRSRCSVSASVCGP